MKIKAFKTALPHTLPICIGFLFIGISYGFLMTSKGFSFFYPMCMSLFICAGSMEFVTIQLLVSSYNPLYAFCLALMVNARHLFYGISMLDTYNHMGWKKWYLIYAMCDESFTINYAITPPDDVDRGWFMFFVTLLNHCYWVAGATLGSFLGYIIQFDTKGIDFVMTILFIVIFIDQWDKSKVHFPAITGIFCSISCLFVFGSQIFILPAMAAIIMCFTLVKGKKKEKMMKL
jgi:4-azaleucine resistance transporter AzlC